MKLLRTPLMMALAVGAFGQSVPLPPLNEDEAALLQVFLRATPLGEGITAFPLGKGGLVPLGELCRLLSFAIEVDGAAGRADGFFISPSRTFHLELANGSVRIGGALHRFEPTQVRAHGRELYVDASLLEAWFPIQVRLVYRESSLYVTSRETLPIEQAWDRDRANARLLGKRPAYATASGPRVEDPYQLFTVPAFDVQVSSRYQRDSGASKPQGSISMGGDLLWMSSQLHVSRDDQGSFASSRATLFRNDPSGGLLGPLKARNVTLGDLQRSASLDLVGALPQGRGVSVDNHPLDFRSAFATRVFRGDLPPGWTVELFQNNALVGYQASRADGTYELPPVNLTFGLNLFRLVFHGPHGERREEQVRLDISQDQPEPGAVYYRFSAVRPTHTAPRPIGTGNQAPWLLSRPVFLAEAEAGLTSGLSAQTGLMRLSFDDGPRTYGVAGVRTVLPWVSLDLTGAAMRHQPTQGPMPRPGLAAMATVRTGLGYSSLTASHSEYRLGFQPIHEVAANRRSPLRREDLAALTTSMDLGPQPVSLTYALQRQAFLEGQRTSHRLMASTSLGRISISPSIGINRDDTSGRPVSSQDAQLLVSAFAGAYNLQAEVQGRKTQGPFQAESYTVNLGRVWTSGLSFLGSVRGSLRDRSAGPSLTASLLQQRGRFGFAMDASHSRQSGFSLGVRLQASFGRDPRTRRWHADAQPLASMGGLSARAFLDTNGNGRMDADERALEDVRFKVGDTSRTERRPAPSVAIYTGLGTGRALTVSLDGASLEDTSQQPAVPSFTFLPRPGVMTLLDYPVVVLGEIMGTVRVRRGGRTEELAGLLVELVDGPTGRILQTQRSAFDGFFEFRGLPLGRFLLRIPAAEVARVKLRPSPQRDLQLSFERSVAEGQDLVVEYLQAPAETAPRLDGPDKAPVIREVTSPTRLSATALPSLPGIPTATLPRLAPPPSKDLTRLLVPLPALALEGPSYRPLSRIRRPMAKPLPPRPDASRVMASRAVSRALAALSFEAYRPGVPSPARRAPISNPDPPPCLPSRTAEPAGAWTLLLMEARHLGTVEATRRRLGPWERELHIHQNGGKDRLFLLFGRYTDLDEAREAANRLPAAIQALGLRPQVVPHPADGASL